MSSLAGFIEDDKPKEEPQEKPFYIVVQGRVCPECKGELLDYQREDDPFFYCLNAGCNTFKDPKVQ